MKYFHMQCMSCRTILIEMLLWKKNFLHMTCRSTDLATRVLAMAAFVCRRAVTLASHLPSIARNQNSLFEQRSYFSFLNVSVALWLFIILGKWCHGPFQPMLYKGITYNILQYGCQVYFWWWQSPFRMMLFKMLTLSIPTLNQTSANRASDWLIFIYYIY